MPKQPPLEKNLLLLHAIVSHFLLKETGGKGVSRRKGQSMTWEMRVQKCHFASDILFEWSFMSIHVKKKSIFIKNTFTF